MFDFNRDGKIDGFDMFLFGECMALFDEEEDSCDEDDEELYDDEDSYDDEDDF